ncbi:MAG: SsrA-binding protein SmpB [Planctomycetes bacterium]|nr:SsrA-binding protein SmpB [Planctomycetota bacterium]
MAKKKEQPKPAADAPQQVLYNRKLRHDYAVIDAWEAGMVLMGSEVKSLRAGDVQWGDAHARMDAKGELWLYGLHIGEYRQAGTFGHEPAQPRKLLLNRKELSKISGLMKGKGLTMIPEQLLFRKGWAKIVICLAKGKTRGDKRIDLVKRATDRDVEREMARRAKRG